MQLGLYTWALDCLLIVCAPLVHVGVWAADSCSEPALTVKYVPTLPSSSCGYEVFARSALRILRIGLQLHSKCKLWSDLHRNKRHGDLDTEALRCPCLAHVMYLYINI